MMSENWNGNFNAAACNHCGVNYVLPPSESMPLCPNCLQEPLELLDAESRDRVMQYPPETVIPFLVEPNSLLEHFDRFVSSVPYRPIDLDAHRLLGRLQQVYMPLWWVDVDAKARWKAEVGFNYEAVSHRETYKSGWHSEEVKEERTRWERRLGELDRHYANALAPALEDDRTFRQRAGKYRMENAEPYAPEQLQNSLLRLPERSPQDAWSDAAPQIARRAQDEIMQACAAQHIRDFSWSANYEKTNWTLILLPLYVTYYIAPDRNRHWVMVNGQSGVIFGERRANLRRALGTSTIIFAISVAVAVVGLLFWLIFGNLLGNILLLIGVVVALLSAIPFVNAWLFNRNQPKRSEALS